MCVPTYLDGLPHSDNIHPHLEKPSHHVVNGHIAS